MANRIVYLVDALPDAMPSDLELVTDEGLSALVNEGFEIGSSLKRAITVAGEKVSATMFVLKSPEDARGVSRTRDPDPEPASNGRGLVQVRDEWGHELSISPAQAMVRELSNALSRVTAVGHLGPPGQHNIPGMQIVSGEMVAKAFDAGALAANSGQQPEDCPFPPGSAPATKWLQGYRGRLKSMKERPSAKALQEAEQAGYDMAKALGADDRAHCPYADTYLEERWVVGFKRGGGRVT